MPTLLGLTRIERLIAAGAGLSAAVRESLAAGDSLVRFARRHRLPRTSLVSALTGRQRETPAMRAALGAELGGSPDVWAQLFAAQRRAVAAETLAAAPHVAPKRAAA